MLYIVYAYDGTDSEAPARRQAARPAHLEKMSVLKETKTVKAAGALLDEEENVVGSMMILDYPSQEALEAEFLATEPYVTGGVWETIQVHGYRPPPELSF